MSWVGWGSLIMGLGVAAGAFGAHGLKDVLTPDAKAIYQTAVFYQLIHGLALFVIAWLASIKPAEGLIRTAGWAFLLGILLFSGSLYALSLTGVRKWGMVTPLGGLAFLIGWASLALAARSLP